MARKSTLSTERRRVSDTEAERIGSAIKDRRDRLGLSQSDLAKQIGVPDMTVSRWERGKNVPEIHRLRALAGIFGCTIDDLVGPTTPTVA